MKTTLEIPDELFREAKAKAALGGIRLKDLVAAALQQFLQGKPGEPSVTPSRAEAPAPPKSKSRRTEFPLLKPGKRPFPYLTNTLIEEIFAEEDAEYYGRFMRR